MLNKSINKYNFAQEVNNYLFGIEKYVKNHNTTLTKLFIGNLTKDLLVKIKEGQVDQKMADKIYLLLDLFLEDNFNELRNDPSVSQLIFEGNILHDLGKPYGANIALMEKLAGEIISNNEL